VGRNPPQPYYPATSRADRTHCGRGPPEPTDLQGNNLRQIMTNEVGRLLTASEVAEMLHLHVNTVKRLGDRGEIPFFRVCKRGDRRFRYDDVIDFLHRNK
jgi:excisionase family DNA binding protein